MDFLKDYNKNAIVYGEEKVSYKELISRTKGISKYLDIEVEDNVIVFSENRPELLYATFSIWEKKGVSVNLDFSSTAEELAYYIEDCTPKYLYTSEEGKETATKAIEIAKADTKILVFEDLDFHYDGDDLVVKSPDPDRVCVMLYTSGTTGKPKGVMLTFDNIKVNMEGLNEDQVFTKEDRVLAVLPMHHIFPLLGAGIVPLAEGSEIVFVTEISSTAIVSALKENKITVLLGVPRLYEMFHKGIMSKIEANKVAKTLFDVAGKVKNKAIAKKLFKKVHEGFGGHIKQLVAGGSRLDPVIANDFDTLGFEVTEGYGMTECAPMISFTPRGKMKIGSAGRILKGIEVSIADDGEVLVKGRNVMKGYYKKEEATKKTIDENGWLHTGDLGEVKDNFLYITGRKKEMIVLSNGKNINPIDIEQFLLKESDLIKEVAITEYNNLLAAIVFPNFQEVRNKGVVNLKESLKWGAIDKYNNEAPNYRKILDVKVIKEELPKTKLGKIRRFMLKDLLDDSTEEKVNEVEPTFEEYAVLKDYLVQQTGKEISPSAHFELDLGLDSLAMVELVSFIEATFGIKADENLTIDNPTVKALAEYLNKNSDEINREGMDWNKILNQDVDITLPKSARLVRFGKWMMNSLLTSMFRLKKSGMHNLPEGPCIIAGNHQSFLDVFLINDSIDKKRLKNVYYLGASKYFENGALRVIANHSNLLAVDRNKHLQETLQASAKVLKSGKSLVIFPEGARTRDGEIAEFKKAFAILSKELNVPIVPFGIKGAYEAYPTDKKFPKSGNVEIKFFEPINPEEKTYEEISDEVREVVKAWVDTKGK